MSNEKIDYRNMRERMVEGLVREGLLHSPSVMRALEKVPRELFVSEQLAPYAYSDVPLPTGRGQTISAPHDISLMSGVTWPRL
jgi:protein-L-isoaspartate(D-aspartate) O-methyltransferase